MCRYTPQRACTATTPHLAPLGKSKEAEFAGRFLCRALMPPQTTLEQKHQRVRCAQRL